MDVASVQVLIFVLFCS